MSSDVPLARQVLQTVLKECDIDDTARRLIRRAIGLMIRAKQVRRARAKHLTITATQKARARRIATCEPDTTYHEIANRTGIANGGRVSEIITGKR
jgi:hypothetical protein